MPFLFYWFVYSISFCNKRKWIHRILFGYHFVNAPSQWVTTLHCNIVSHWSGAYTNWSLLLCFVLCYKRYWWHRSGYEVWCHRQNLLNISFAAFFVAYYLRFVYDYIAYLVYHINSWCLRWDISGELSLYHGCRCLGSICRQATQNHDRDYLR